MLEVDAWQLTILGCYLIGLYLFALYSYRVMVPAKRLSGGLTNLRALVSKYFPPKP